jgi:hypothetical protein
MTPIAAKQLVRAPLGSAHRLLQAFFAANPGAKGARARVKLRAGDASQSAVVMLRQVHRPQDMTPHYNVHWEAESGGPFPVFDGELTIGADEDYDAFWLELHGVYAPPGGLAGQLFDSVIGRRIADETSRRLLGEIAAAMERGFAREELAKNGQVSER